MKNEMQIDRNVLAVVVAQALLTLNRISNRFIAQRWASAIEKASERLAKQDVQMWTPGAPSGGLVVFSARSNGRIYHVTNEGCQCVAWHEGFPCWHRAALRLLQRYNEVTEEQQRKRA